MQVRSLDFTARITKKGQLLIDNSTEFHNFLTQFKGGMLKCRFEIQNGNTSKLLTGYYYKVVVPKFQQAFFDKGNRYTLDQAEKEVRRLSPVIWEEEFDDAGVYHSKMKRMEQLDSFDQVLFLEHLKQIAAEDFSIFIEDPVYL